MSDTTTRDASGLADHEPAPPSGVALWGPGLLRPVTAGLLTAATVLVLVGVGCAAPPGLRVVWPVTVAALPALLLIDARHRLLPAVIIRPVGLLVALATAVSLAAGTVGAGDVAWATGVAAGAFLFYGGLMLIAPVGGVGMGDVRLVPVLAFALALAHPLLAVVALVIAPPLLGIVQVLITALITRRPVASLPFGPALIVSTVLAMVFHGPVISAATSALALS